MICAEGHERIKFFETDECPLCKEQTNLLLAEAQIEELTGTIDALTARLERVNE